MLDGPRAAVGFLTRVPIPIGQVVMGQAAPWFPVVGILIGGFQAAVWVAGRTVLDPLPAAVLATAAAALLTGAFHHDGLADVADAFGGGWDVEQRMAILKDSRLGTYGTTALILAFATEVSTVASLDTASGARALVAAHALSRAVAVATMRVAPLAGDGMGAAYAADLRLAGTLAAMAVGLTTTVVALWDPVAVVAAVGLSLLAAGLMVTLAKRKIGGVTGDVLGAVQVLAALAVLVAAAATMV
ncbi:MAG: adenosylcobinamide-GDP ribazoletransferase [Actinomycetota bacterium]